MSDGIDPLKDIFHLTDQERQALQLASSIIGTVSSVWGAFNTAMSVLTALGLHSKADQVAEMRHYIDQLVQEFDGVVAALDKEHSMRDVANQLESARTEFDNLIEFAPEDVATVGINPVWDELRPFVLDNSLRVVNTLGDPAYWNRVFFPELTYQNYPHNVVYDDSPYLGPDPTGLVFDYRLTLPAYLEAIAIRLIILIAVVKDYHHVAVSELTNMITTLEGYFKRIRQGIKDIGVQVRPVELVGFDYPGSSYWDVDSWAHAGALVGSVEIYSACNSVAAWPADEFPLVNFPGRGTAAPETVDLWQKFLVRYAVRNWMRWKKLYDMIGLNAVAATIVTLKRMVGTEPATLPDPDVPMADNSYTSKKIRGGDYSLRELAQMMHDISLTQSGIWAILSDERGNMVSPISLRGMLNLLQTYSSEPYTSFRKAMQQ